MGTGNYYLQSVKVFNAGNAYGLSEGEWFYGYVTTIGSIIGICFIF